MIQIRVEPAWEVHSPKEFMFPGNLENPGKSNDFHHAPLLWGAWLAEDRQRGTVVAGSEPMKTLGNHCISRSRSLTGSVSNGAAEERPLGILWFLKNLWNPWERHGFAHPAVDARFTCSGRDPAEHLGITPRNQWKTLYILPCLVTPG